MNKNEYEKSCQWIGEGDGCDKPSVGSRSYCDQHVWRVYDQGTALRARKKDQRRAEEVWQLISEIDSIAAELEDEF